MNLFGTLRAPRELLFGAGQRHALGGIAAKLGQRALIVTDTRLAVDADLLALVQKAKLEEAGLEVMVDSSTLPDVPVESAISERCSGQRLCAGPRHRHRWRVLARHGEMRRPPPYSRRAATGLITANMPCRDP